MRQTIKRLMKRMPFLSQLTDKLHKSVQHKQERERIKKLARRSPIRLVIGASGIYDAGWIGTDIEYLNLLKPEHWEIYFKRDSIDAILAEHVWEHLNAHEGLAAAIQCFEYLKPKGYLRAAVPDGFCPDEEYINYVKPGGTGPGADDHKVLFNYRTFKDMFEKAGFQVKLLEYYDEGGRFHFVDWTPETGKIRRSRRFDERNRNGKLNYTSLILDAHKDGQKSVDQ